MTKFELRMQEASNLPLETARLSRQYPDLNAFVEKSIKRGYSSTSIGWGGASLFVSDTNSQIKRNDKKWQVNLSFNVTRDDVGFIVIREWKQTNCAYSVIAKIPAKVSNIDMAIDRLEAYLNDTSEDFSLEYKTYFERNQLSSRALKKTDVVSLLANIPDDRRTAFGHHIMSCRADLCEAVTDALLSLSTA